MYMQPWAVNDYFDTINMDSIPEGLWSAYIPAAQNSYEYATDISDLSQLDYLSETNTTADLRSHTQEITDLPLSPPPTPSASTASTPAKVSKKRGRPPCPAQRKTHNEIEARYRGTINAAIKALQQVVPQMTTPDGTTIDEGKRPIMSKAAVMIGAASYIKHLEEEHRRLMEENKFLRTTILENQLLLTGKTSTNRMTITDVLG